MKETGAFWNGGSQDTYMGALNSFLYKSVPFLQNMATVAGMSNASIGMANTAGRNVFDPMEYGSIAETYAERQYPMLSSETCGYHRVLLRLNDIGVAPDTYVMALDWPSILRKDLMLQNRKSPLYDRFRQEVEVMGKRADRLFGHEITLPKEPFLSKIAENNAIIYDERDSDREIVVDSRKLGIVNIAGAAEYMKKRVTERWK
jgi:hypothetical protein